MSSKILTNILENIVINNEDTIAITSGEKLITYQELNDQANYIANFLLSLNISRESVITTFLSDKALQIESLLGIFKSGKIYLPFDVKYGQNHWEELLTKIQPKVLLVSQEYLERLKKYQSLFQQSSLKIITIEAGNSKPSFSEIFIETFEKTEINTENISSETPKIVIADNDSNYIFFTSGTTGKPKAVLGSHISLSHFVHWEIKELDIKDKIQVAQITSLSFDASLRDIFVAFITGSTLHIPDQDTRNNHESLIKWLSLKKINLLHTIPTMLKVITSAGEEMEDHTPDLSELQYILLAGEKLYVKNITKWRALFGNKTVFYNLYGATESTLIKTFYKIPDLLEADITGSIPAGHPISNTRILILNENGDLCKIHEKGRVYIKTPFLSKGYYKNLEATAQKFIQNPLNDQKDIIYDTGDLGKYDQDRNLIIIGREDGEVKINGVRVDINSMESTISDFDGVDMVKCIVHIKNNNNTIICFYTSKILIDNDLRKMCTEYLTVYEQPLLIKIEEFPTNANGKVDVKRLKQEVENYISDKREIIPPSNATEEKLLDIWKEVLGFETISIKDSFFQLGGNSITAIRLLNKINKENNLSIRLNELYQNSSIISFAKIMTESLPTSDSEIVTRPIEEKYLCSNSQKRIWLTSAFNPKNDINNRLVALEIEGEFSIEKLNLAFQKTINKHESLRTLFKFVKNDIYQYIIKIEDVDFKIEEIEGKIDSFLEENNHKFELDKNIGIKVILLNDKSKDKYFLLIYLHHIISDAWSDSILFNEIITAYNDKQLEPLKIQYKDYVYWLDKRKNKDEDFWKNFLESCNYEDVLSLDFDRNKDRTYSGDTLSIELEYEDFNNLKENLKFNQINPSDFFVSIYGILLSKISNTNNFTIGTVVNGRTNFDIESLIGVFINYLPLKININDPKLSLIDFIKRQSVEYASVYDHQLYPFDLMVKNFYSSNDNSRNPIFDTALLFQSIGENKNASLENNSLKIKSYNFGVNHNKIAELDLKVDVMYGENSLSIHFQYNTNLFKNQTIENFLNSYKKIIKAFLININSRIEEITI
ncbi:hypothetical protein D1632_14435 [Chryseobacterium nematophagum]|uniref:Carrier domain-containing protein n=1 Tax=Chryseobacterium nematophagum TaxID=2305228 RepID=A0A3M7L979_9FLAO|nr:condensation domain-containing protein [Chryseobacterium nematophagum]RMZ58779.1 hypothetical protein D1632_14435 [Chryseobacterium nematophagum]